MSSRTKMNSEESNFAATILMLLAEKGAAPIGAIVALATMVGLTLNGLAIVMANLQAAKLVTPVDAQGNEVETPVGAATVRITEAGRETIGKYC